MSGPKIATSRDIYIEVNGRRAAVVESYEAKAIRELYNVEELGGSFPAALLSGNAKYRLTLKRVQLAGENPPDFYSLSEFDVVIVKPERRIVYSGCEWEEIREGVSAGQPCMETVILTARRRAEL